MSKLDELFDDFLSKAKSAADVAGKKTNDVMEFSKAKYQVKQIQWDVEKCYSKLGAFVYESKNSEEDFSDLIALAVKEIDLLNEKLEILELQLLSRKNAVKCSGCGKENDLAASFCARCGSSLAEDKEKAEAANQTPAEEDAKEDAQEVAETMDELNKEVNQED